MIAHIIFPALPRDLLDQLAGDRIEDIVIGEARAKTRLGFQKGDALDRLPAGEVGARHEHQIVLPQPQTAAMDEQVADGDLARYPRVRSEEHTAELQSLMRTSYAVFCLQ